MDNARAGILTIAGDPAMRGLLRRALVANGYAVIDASNDADARTALQGDRPALAVLDFDAADTGSIDLLKALKADPGIPVILLTVRSTEKPIVEATRLGADDVISKPFALDRLLGSVALALANASEQIPPAHALGYGPIRIDLLRHSVTRGGEPIRLAPSEWRLLEALVQRPGEPQLYQELLSRVWGPEYRNDLDYLRMWIDRLREKLGDDRAAPRMIRSYLDVGYICAEPGR